MKMGCRVMYDANDDAACLYDSVTETVFGKRFIGDGAEKAEAFLQWCLREHGDPRKLDVSRVVDLQDEWLASLDTGCSVCHAEPWETCDKYAGEHERKPWPMCSHTGCDHPATHEQTPQPRCFAHRNRRTA